MLLIIARRRLGPSPGCPGPNTLPAQGNAPAFPSHPSTPFPAFGQGATWEKTTKAGSSGTSGCHRDPSRLGKSRTRSSHGHWVALLFLNKIRRRRRIYRAFIGIAASPSPPSSARGQSLGPASCWGWEGVGRSLPWGRQGQRKEPALPRGQCAVTHRKGMRTGRTNTCTYPSTWISPWGKEKTPRG